MGEGLKQAVLEALCTRGPWRGVRPRGFDWTLTGDEVRALYAAIAASERYPLQAINCGSASERKADRALRLLRQAGLIEFSGTGPCRMWRAVGVAGEAKARGGSDG